MKPHWEKVWRGLSAFLEEKDPKRQRRISSDLWLDLWGARLHDENEKRESLADTTYLICAD
jgi:hypothetical protein